MKDGTLSRREFTPEETSKGGKTESPMKSLSRVLSVRKHCTVTCRFFESCPVNAMSLGYIDPKTGEKGKCLMKDFPHTVRQQFINMFLTGEEGLIQQIKTMIHHYLVDIEAYGNIRDKRDAIQMMLVFYDKVYNNPRKGSIAKEPLTITIRRVGMAPETMQINPRGALPKGVTLKDVLADQNGDITEGDPETLIGSEMLDALIRIEKPLSRPLFMEEIKIESNFERILGDE